MTDFLVIAFLFPFMLAFALAVVKFTRRFQSARRLERRIIRFVPRANTAHNRLKRHTRRKAG